MDVRESIKILADAYGVSGDETNTAKAAAEMLRPYVDHVSFDEFGNVIGFKSCGKENAPKLLLDAHLDQIGFMVSEVTEDGFVRFAAIGGLDQRVLLGSQIVILTKEHGEIPGVIATIPPHLLVLMDTSKTTPIEEMVIDVGLPPEMAKAQIHPGDFAAYEEKAFDMPGGVICGKAMDDRACFICILRALEILRETALHCDIVVTGTIKEEIGFHGAIVAGYNHPVDLAIAVDVCHAKTGDTTIIDNVYEFNGGPVVSFGSSSLPGIARKLVNRANEKGIPVQLAACPDFSGTNAWAFQLAKNGIPTVTVSLPLKYMHTPVEMISMKDVENLSLLLAAFAKTYGAGEANHLPLEEVKDLPRPEEGRI